MEFGDVKDTESVNGFAVFRQLLEDRGCDVTTTSLLTPKLDQQDVLIWLHNSYRLPQSEAFERVNEWQVDNYGQLVFIGNDYNAKPTFLEDVYENSSVADRQWARVVSRMEMSREQEDLDYVFMPGFNNDDRYIRFSDQFECDLFSVVNAPTGFLGTWTLEDSEDEDQASPQPELPTIRVRNYLKPKGDYETLASCSNNARRLPLIWRKSESYRGETLVVSSASFLSNYGVTKPANGPLIDLVLDEIPANSKVLILQSGPNDVPLSSTPEDRIVKTWAWMKHGPFPIAILHVLALAVVFCFARFPVFGRAKEIEFRPRNDFGLHLEEIGRLLRGTRQQQYAESRVRHYFEVVKRSLIGRGPRGRS